MPPLLPWKWLQPLPRGWKNHWIYPSSCSNAKYGCSVKTSYYEREDHKTECHYAPCFCPDTGCSFSASTGMLQEHFTTEHHWPSTKCRYGWFFYADVKEGIHVISSEDEQLFLLSIASEPFGCVISVFCVQPHDTEPKFRCAVSFSFWKNNSYHTQSSEFQVPSTTLSDGLPRDRFLFILPRFYIEEGSRVCVTMKKDSAFQREKTDTLDADCYSSPFSFRGMWDPSKWWVSYQPYVNATVAFSSKSASIIYHCTTSAESVWTEGY